MIISQSAHNSDRRMWQSRFGSHSLHLRWALQVLSDTATHNNYIIHTITLQYIRGSLTPTNGVDDRGIHSR